MLCQGAVIGSKCQHFKRFYLRNDFVNCVEPLGFYENFVGQFDSIGC